MVRGEVQLASYDAFVEASAEHLMLDTVTASTLRDI